MKKNKKFKGFTLIELLAIIVILAIIAVITVPIILNVIENSRVGAAKDSAYGYKDAINKYYVSELYENLDFKLSGTYTITDKGRLSNEKGVYEIPFTGTTPTGGNLTYENNILKDGCITMDEYKVTIENGEITTVEKGVCETLVVELKTYTDGEIVYFNPIGGAVCTEQEYQTNTATNPLINTGCLKWHTFLDEEGKTEVNMILDHNTTAFVAWATYEDYNNATDATTIKNTYGVTYANNTIPTYSAENHSKGPLTLLKQLKTDTDGWSAVLTRSDSYSVNLTNGSSQEINYTIDYSGYKARLLSVEEVAQITGANKPKSDGGIDWVITNTTPSDWYFFDSLTQSSSDQYAATVLEGKKSKYAWLFDRTSGCLNSGCNIEDSSTYGYWTSSPRASYSHSAWPVKNGNLSFNPIDVSAVSGTSNAGLRPVITVPKKILQ